MQRIDHTAINTFKIPRLLLMEHAGLALARAVHQQASAHVGAVLVCCGTGYNGGDGFAAARHLLLWGHRVRVILTGRRAQLREEPAVYAAILTRLKVEQLELTTAAQLRRCEAWIRWSDVVVDALLGIGVQGLVREPVASLIRRINASEKPVIAADIPSGLNGDTGEPCGIAVRATMTVTFELPKQGCFTRPGRGYAGDVRLVPIGIPQEAVRAA